MSLDACAALVSRGDPARFRAAMCAPMPQRGDLMALYAFNLEVARAPFVTDEPMIAMMRVQWWADALDEIFAGAPPRAHEVVTPLAGVIERHGLTSAPFQRIARARQADAQRREVPSREALLGYLSDTSGALTALAAQVLGGDLSAQSTAETFGTGTGAARYLAALSRLKSRGRPIPGEEADTRVWLVSAAQEHMRTARARRPRPPRSIAPAFLAEFGADRVLAAATPQSASQEPEGPRQRFAFWAAHITGRW